MMAKTDSAGFFGDWLKQRRKSLDLTQEELAQRAGCSVFALRKIESGERRPSRQLAHLLATALGITPEDRQSFVRAARGELAVGRLRSPVRASPAALGQVPEAPAVLTRLPVQATPLIGRENELAAMARLFSEPGCRLLTLTGLGGIGKTRLAIEFAARQAPSFPGGVCYVSLASLSTPELIVPAIADTVGLTFSGPADLKEQLLRSLGGPACEPMLLALDNLEHLLAPPIAAAEASAACLVAEILSRLPHVKVLATSRERLNLQEEWTYEIHGLPVPSPDFVGRLEEYGAAALFIQSARRTRQDFALSSAEGQALAQICQMLDGIPLAIELAAAWAGVLSCEEIADEIRSNLDFLRTNLRNVPARHRSLRATFDHSWQLLSAEERQVLSRLAVFHGGFDRHAANRVAGATLPLLASLVAKSLVRRTESGRYDLHEVIRQYAITQAEADPGYPAACDQHAAYYLGLLKARESALKSGRRQEAFRELTGELDNIRAAWEWAIQRRQDKSIEQALRGLAWLLETGGLLSEGVAQFELLVQALQSREPTPECKRLLGQAYAQQSLLLFRQGRFDQTQVRLGEALALLRPLGEPALLADALLYLAIIKHLNGELDVAEALVSESLACAQASGSRWFVAYAIFNLGYIASLRGSYEEGQAHMRAGLALWRELGDPHSIAMGLNYLSPTLIKLGRYGEARTGLEESLALSATVHDHWGMGTAYRQLGLTSMAQGDFSAARSFFCKSLEAFKGFVIGWDIGRTLSYLAEATLAAGDVDEARQHYLEALRVAQEVKAIPLTMDVTAGLAQLEALTGHRDEALRLAQSVLAQEASTEEARERAARLCAELEVS